MDFLKFKSRWKYGKKLRKIANLNRIFYNLTEKRQSANFEKQVCIFPAFFQNFENQINFQKPFLYFFGNYSYLGF